MRLPAFNASHSLYTRGGRHRHTASHESRGDAVVPAIPHCDNCDEILDRCVQNGGFPRAVCRACARGSCYDGVENLPPQPPGFPRDWFPRW